MRPHANKCNWGGETFRHAVSIRRPLLKGLLKFLVGCLQTQSLETSARVAPIGRAGRVRVGIITIIEEEFEAAKLVFGLDHNVVGTPYFVDGNNAVAEWDVALIQASDRSNVPAAAAATDFMEDLRPQVMILLGVAGGLCGANNLGRDGIRTGDVLFADQVDYIEFLKIDNNTAKVRSYAIDHPSEPLRTSVCAPISRTFSIRDALGPNHQPPDAGAPCKIHVGGIVSGEKVLGDVHSPIQRQLLEPFDKPLAVDMESIGMARAVCHGRGSFWYHPRYVIIRGISDLVADVENNEQRAQWKSFAAHAAALVARRFVEALPPDIGGN
jgi:nucleoside phosphorylase